MIRATPTRPIRRTILAAVVALVCGMLIAVSVHMSLLWTAQAHAARTSHVTATVLEPAAPERSRPAIGRWTTTDGAHHIGVISAPPGRSAGATYPIWVDEAGRITSQPKSAVHRATQTALAGIAVTVAVILLTRPGPRRDDPIATE